MDLEGMWGAATSRARGKIAEVGLTMLILSCTCLGVL